MAIQTASKRKSVRDQVSKAEWAKRVDLAACYRLIDLYGMSEMSANHASTRVPDEDGAFLINPHGLLYEQMHASCFIKLDLDGNILFNPTELGINKAGFVIHGAIHGARHDVDCVIHTHTVAGMAVSAMKCGLMPIAQTSMRFAQIGYHDYEGIAIDANEQASLVRDLGDHAGMILRNHGLLVVGASSPIRDLDLMVPRYDIVPIPEHLRRNMSAGSIMEFPAETAQSMNDFRADDQVGNISPRPLLLLHSANDSVTPTYESIEMFKRARQPAELHLLSDVDHFTFNQENQRLTHIVSDWLERYFPVQKPR